MAVSAQTVEKNCVGEQVEELTFGSEAACPVPVEAVVNLAIERFRITSARVDLLVEIGPRWGLANVLASVEASSNVVSVCRGGYPNDFRFSAIGVGYEVANVEAPGPVFVLATLAGLLQL